MHYSIGRIETAVHEAVDSVSFKSCSELSKEELESIIAKSLSNVLESRDFERFFRELLKETKR